MEQTKHTPGPWHFDEHYLTVQVNDEDVDYHGNPIKFIIARANDTANARLIAAAPELLEAAKDVAAMLGQGHWTTAQFSRLHALRAAIAKATGKNL